jgi:hypothetical protein
MHSAKLGSRIKLLLSLRSYTEGRRERGCVLLFFFSILAFYLAFAPSTAEYQGYSQRIFRAANQIADNILSIVHGSPIHTIDWPHHGFAEPLLQTPVALCNHLFFDGSEAWLRRIILLHPILLTTLLCTLVFAWIRRICVCPRYCFWLAIATGLATMLWPYSYISLETSQSLALLLAAFLVLGRSLKGTWSETCQFALIAAIAVVAKMSSILLLPAILWLTWLQFWSPHKVQHRWAKLFATLAVIFSAIVLNVLVRTVYWKQQGGEAPYLASILVKSPLDVLQNFFSFFCSPNKSLFLFAPVTLLSVLALKQAYKTRPALAIFSLLVLTGLAGGFATMIVWGEETWGPRYLHSAIAPLVICLASTKSARRFTWRQESPLLAAILLGLLISFLGVFSAYGCLYEAATRTTTSTLEAYQFDPRFNHARFNLKLFLIWAQGRLGVEIPPEHWPPPPNWWFTPPPDAPSTKTYDLRNLAIPQPVLLRGWSPSSSGTKQTYQLLRWLACFCLVSSSLGFWRCAKITRSLAVHKKASRFA